MRKLICLLPVFLSFSLFAQNGPTSQLSVRGNGVANASVAFDDINSIFNNQAGLAELEITSFLFSGEQTYINPKSNNFGAGFVVPTYLGTFGVNAHFFQFENFDQWSVGFAYARKLAEKFSMGVQLDMLSTQISGTGFNYLFTFEVGFQYQLTQKLLLGIHIDNPINLEIATNEFLPTVLRTGGTFSITEHLVIHAELEKDFDFSFVFKSGVEYELAKNLWLRIGYQHRPTTFSYGIGYRFRNGLRFDFATFYQKGLDYTPRTVYGPGFIPSVGVGYDFIKK